MISLLRRIRKTLIDTGHSRRYLLYAVGEITLVVIGILLALQINNWSEKKKLIYQESLLLQEMVKNLKIDLAQLEDHYSWLNERATTVNTLSEWLKKGELRYHDSLHTYFGAVYGVEDIDINFANYEDLKSRGFDLIQDDDLRFQINQFFEKVISRMDGYKVSEEAVNQVMKPYYLQNFREIDFRYYAVPIDSDQLLKDEYYQNLVHYRLIIFQRNQLDNHPWIIEGISELIQNIENYLAS